MEATVAEIKPYRPKKGVPVIDEDKMYEFELVTRNEAIRPVDKETGLPLGSGYPPSSSIPNFGTAYNAKTKKYENWRYIEGQPSPFVSEQTEITDYEKKEIDTMLAEGQNDLEFRDGKMLVRGDSSGKLRLEVMFLSDYFVGNEKPRHKVQQSRMFRLNNPDAVIEEQNDIEDLAFRTMTQARNCTITEMLAISALLGINIDDTSSAGMNRIKNAFLTKAKYNPAYPKGKQALEQFVEIINNPTTKMKYLINQGLLRGLLSTTMQPGKLVWAKLDAPILELTGKLPTADELTARAIDKEEIVVNLLVELETQINKK